MIICAISFRSAKQRRRGQQQSVVNWTLFHAKRKSIACPMPPMPKKPDCTMHHLTQQNQQSAALNNLLNADSNGMCHNGNFSNYAPHNPLRKASVKFSYKSWFAFPDWTRKYNWLFKSVARKIWKNQSVLREQHSQNKECDVGICSSPSNEACIVRINLYPVEISTTSPIQLFGRQIR